MSRCQRWSGYAADKGWRIHLLTKSACTPANLSVMLKGKPYRKCDAWRKSAFKVIKRLKPDMVIVASTSEYDLVGLPYSTTQRYFDTWRAGVADTLRKVGKSAGQVVLLNDVPKHAQDPVECLLQHVDDVTACSTPRDVAMRPQMVDAYRGAAADAGATFVDPTPLVCPGSTPAGGRRAIPHRVRRQSPDAHLLPAHQRPFRGAPTAHPRALTEASPEMRARDDGRARARARSGRYRRWP